MLSTSARKHLVCLAVKTQVDTASFLVTEGTAICTRLEIASYLSKEGIIHIFLYPFLLSPLCSSKVNIRYHRVKYSKWECFRCWVSLSIMGTIAEGKDTLAIFCSTALGVQPNTGKSQLVSFFLASLYVHNANLNIYCNIPDRLIYHHRNNIESVSFVHFNNLILVTSHHLYDFELRTRSSSKTN